MSRRPEVAEEGLGAGGEFRLRVGPAVAKDAPLIVLQGWYGCQDKYLSKYSDLVEDLGCASLRAIMPTSILFGAPGPQQAYARTLLDAVCGSSACEGRPLILYAFSNGGCLPLAHQVHALTTDDKYAALLPRLRGLVFDSCPAFPSASAGALAFSSGAPFPLSALMRGFFVTASYFQGYDPMPWWKLWQEENHAVPRLYLYSADDLLTECAKVEELIQEKKDKGLEVHTQKWESSEHVGHLRRHPEEYRAAVAGFLAGLKK